MSSGIRLTGLVSGLDSDALVSQLMALERKPLDSLKKQQNSLKTVRDTWKDVNTRLANLQGKAASLASRTTFFAKSTGSTDDTVATGSASSSAANGIYEISVTTIARAHVVNSNAQASNTAALGLAGTVTINGKSITVVATDSLESVRDRINSTADVRVTAAVVKVNTTDYKLVLTSTATGTANTITMTDGGGVLAGLGLMSGGVPNTIQAAVDAQFSVNGVAVVRSSNTVDDVVPGLTLTLKKGGSTTIDVKSDAESVVRAVRDFVDQYNSVVDFLSQKTSYDPDTKVAGPLLGDSTASLLLQDIRRMATGAVAGLPVTLNNFQQVGITTGAWGSSTGKDGKLTLDESKLRDILTKDLTGVAKLFGAVDNNVALGSSGATVVASSELDAAHAAAGIINGVTSSDRWGTDGGGWQDNTSGVFPDYVDIDFGAVKTIDQINVYTINSATMAPETYGVRDYILKYWTGADWSQLATVTDNTRASMTHEFEAVSTSKIRLEVNKVNGTNDYTRIVEVEAYEKNYGVAHRLSDYLTGYTKAGGVLPERKDSLDKQIKRLDSQILKTENRLADREARLRKELADLEKVMSSLQSQGQWLTSQLANMPSSSLNRKS